MARNDSVATLSMTGGHPVLDFANTVASRRDRFGPDCLLTYDDLVAWAVRAGLLDDAGAGELRAAARTLRGRTGSALAQAKALREAIHEVFRALAAGRAPPREALAILQKAARQARRSARLVSDGRRFRWVPVSCRNLDVITHLVAEEAVRLLEQEHRLARIRECPGRNCGWLFLDTSRSGRRRWCSEADCGTAARVRRHRARKQAGSAGRGAAAH